MYKLYSIIYTFWRLLFELTSVNIALVNGSWLFIKLTIPEIISIPMPSFIRGSMTSAGHFECLWYLQIRSKNCGSRNTYKLKLLSGGPWIPGLICPRQEKSLATKSKFLVWYFDFWSQGLTFRISRFWLNIWFWNLESRNRPQKNRSEKFHFWNYYYGFIVLNMIFNDFCGLDIRRLFRNSI